MMQWTTVLVASQDNMSRVYEARKQKVTYTRNPVTLLTTEKNKFNKWINGIVKLIADQIAQAQKNNNVESTATLSITSLENEGGMDIVFFLLVHNIIGPSNGNAEIVPASVAGGRGYEDRVVANARMIPASPNNQSESFCKTSSTPTNFEDLQWTERPIEESYRRHFLDNFTRYNEILRGRGNYYAARTSRYTTVQSNLMPLGAVPQESPKRSAIENPNRSFKKLRESQTYRIILPDQKSNALVERKNTTDTRDWFTENFIAGGLALREADHLLKQSQMLRIALQKADNVNAEMLSHTEANLEEILASDRHLLEKTNHDHRRSNLAEAARLHLWARSLENERFLAECERRDLKQERQEFMEMKTEFERYRQLSVDSVREEKRLMAKQRDCLDQDRRDLLAQRAELQRLDLAKSGNFRSKERSLEDQRRGLEQEKQEFLAFREDLERTYDLKVISLMEKEASLERTRLDLEYTRLEQLAERERLRQQEIENASSLRDRERSMDQEYRAKVGHLKEKERCIDQDYRRKIDSLEEKERSMDRDYKTKIDRLGEKERSMDRDYRAKVDSMMERETSMMRDYRDQADSLMAMERSLENQRRNLEQYQEKLGAEKRELRDYYEAKVSGLREREQSVEKHRRGLERERSNLSTREDELTAQRNRARSTSPKVIVKKENVSFLGGRSTEKGVKVGFEVSFLPDVFSVEIPWPPVLGSR